MKLLFWIGLLLLNGSFFIFNITHMNEVVLPIFILNVAGTIASVLIVVGLLFDLPEESDGVNTKYTTESENKPRKKTPKKKDAFAQFEATLKQTRKEQGQATK